MFGTHQPTLKYSASCHICPFNSCGDAFAVFPAGIIIWSRVHHSQPGLCLFSRICTGWIDRLQMVVVVFLGKLPLVKMSLMDVGEEFLSHITPSPLLFEYNEGDCRKTSEWLHFSFFQETKERRASKIRLFPITLYVCWQCPFSSNQPLAKSKRQGWNCWCPKCCLYNTVTAYWSSQSSLYMFNPLHLSYS